MQTSMQTCLAHVERGYGNSGRIHEMSGHDPFLSYASQYWPVHFHQRHSCDRCTIRVLASILPRRLSNPGRMAESLLGAGEERRKPALLHTFASRGIFWQRTLGLVVDQQAFPPHFAKGQLRPDAAVLGRQSRSPRNGGTAA